MKIAIAYNSDPRGEHDTPETIAMIAEALRAHDVTAVSVDRPVEELVDLLRCDVVFNLAEGRRGRFREAFYPALYEHLGLAYTGSSPSTLAVCLDKALAKRIVAAAGVAVPGPVMVKPRFEGSSIGITQGSVTSAHGDYVVEELVDGIDVAVGYVAGYGVLDAVRYIYKPRGSHSIMCAAVKRDVIPVEVVDLPAVRAAAETAFIALGVTGFGRADFRVRPDGRVVFLEMNPLPSLAAPGNELYAAAARRGLTPDRVIGAILAATMNA